MAEDLDPEAPRHHGTNCPYCHGKVGCYIETAEHICPQCGGCFRFEIQKLYTAVGVAQGSHPPPPDLGDNHFDPEDAEEEIAAWEKAWGAKWRGDRRWPFNRHYVYGDGALDPDWASKVKG